MENKPNNLKNSPKKGFTLLELLIVIATIAILAGSVLVVINPAEIIKKSRDSKRILDIDQVADAINLIISSKAGNLDMDGSYYNNTCKNQANQTIYLSLIDTTTTCQNLINSGYLSSPPTNWYYHCPTSTSLAVKTNGRGWLPIDFNQLNSLQLSNLPLDPSNSPSKGFYYSYVCDNNKKTFELNTAFESSKYLSKIKKDGGDTYFLYEAGTDLTLSPIKAYSGWLSSNWQYRKQITIKGNSGSGTNYQIKLLVGESPSASGSDFNLESHSTNFPQGLNQGGDLTFTSADGRTILPFWVEKVQGTSPNRIATIWLKMDAGLGEDEIAYCYYGNNSATNANDSTNTMVLGETFGGASDDCLYSSSFDGKYLYIVGNTHSEGQGSKDALVVKIDKNLNIISKKIYGGNSYDDFWQVVSDNDYLYLVGATHSEGQGYYDALILKMDKNLNIISKKIYGGNGWDWFDSIVLDNGYLYIAGSTDSEGQGSDDALILKMDKNLNIISKKIYGGNDDDDFNSVALDNGYLYIVGSTDSEGQGSADALILKMDKNLNIISKKIYGGNSYDYFNSVVLDGGYLYIVGYTHSEGQGSDDALILKMDKNLNIISKKIYGGNDDDDFNSVVLDGGYLYIVGYTHSEGQGSDDALILKMDKNLNIISKKIYGGSESEILYSSILIDNDFYSFGRTSSTYTGNNYDAFILKFPKTLNLKEATPTDYVFQESNLTYVNSNLTYVNSNLTYVNSNLTYVNSSLTYQNSSLSYAHSFYLRKYHLPEPYFLSVSNEQSKP